MCSMHKVFHGKVSHIISQMFAKNLSKVTRQRHFYKILKSNYSAYEKTIAIQGPKIFNSLFNLIEINCSIHTYAKQVREYYIMNLKI